MFFDRLKTGKTNNLAGVLSVHDGKVQTVSRKKDNEELIAPDNMVVNVVGTIQPGTLKRMFREFNATENGLAYRFWYVGIKDHKIDHTIECQTSEEEMKLISNDLVSKVSTSPTKGGGQACRRVGGTKGGSATGELRKKS